jgi:hypothetical protein
MMTKESVNRCLRDDAGRGHQALRAPPVPRHVRDRGPEGRHGAFAEKRAIWWLDGRSPHQLDVPVVGRFEDGVGTFLADDMFEGRPIKVRFLWTCRDIDNCRWEQAFSEDAGKSWETNWTMDFARRV